MNIGMLNGGSNECVDWMFPQFHSIKDTSTDLVIYKIIKVYFGNVGGFESSETVGTSIHHGS